MVRNKTALIVVIFFSLLTLPITSSAQIWKKPYHDYQFRCGSYGGSLVLGASGDPKTFNPVVAKEASSSRITNYIFEGLTKLDPRTLEIIPNLARSWQTEDGKKWIFYLRDDVFWNDGEKFTADDVVFTFKQLIYNPQIPSSSRNIFTLDGKQIRVKKISEYKVSFTLPDVFASFLMALTTDILPQHKYQSYVEQEAFNFSMGLDERPEDIVGTGPFKLKRYTPGERVVLVRNQYYWQRDNCGKQLPYLDKIVFLILPNPDMILLKFFEGEIDSYGLTPQQLPLLAKKQQQGNFSIYNLGVDSGSNFIILNQNPENNPRTQKPFVLPYKLRWFQDLRFRRALSYAINREKIISVLFNKLGVPQYSPLSPSNKLFYTDDIKRYPYRPEKACTLLKEMGFSKEGGSKFFQDSQGNKVEINFFTNADNNTRLLIAGIIKEDLQDIGIKVNFLPLDFNNLVTKLTATYDWEMAMIGFTGVIDPYFSKNVWSYRGTLHAWNPTKEPLFEYEQQINDIFNKASKTLGIEQRKELYKQWQQIVARELPLIYTVLPYSLVAVRDRFGNLYPTIHGGAFSQIEHIFIKNK
jgi:peptide/nickel transport system substrate-binding protein